MVKECRRRGMVYDALVTNNVAGTLELGQSWECPLSSGQRHHAGRP